MNIHKAIVVRCPPEAAFRIFTREIGRWWPLARGFSFDREHAHEILLEDRVGGRFYERLKDGGEIEIGRVVRCDPPHLIRFTWKAPSWEDVTEVEVRFSAEAGGTRVELEHRGFDALPQPEEKSERFAGGWQTILREYAAHIDQQPRRGAMKLYHFPSPNPQKVTFALIELGLNYQNIPVDLAKGEQKRPEFLAVNPAGRVPVLVDGDVRLTESHAILAYLGEKTGRLWPASAGGRAEALQWLFFLSQHIMPPAGQVALRIRAKVVGIPVDETIVAQGEQALNTVLPIVEGHLGNRKWALGAEFGLVDCAYCPVLNVIEKAGFGLAGFPKTKAYLDACRARPAWQDTPKLPGL